LIAAQESSLASVVRVNVFPGVQNLPLFAGLAKGFFAKHGLEVELQFTPNSQTQRDGLSQGLFEIAHAAVDNAVAMVEMAGAQVVIVLGGDSSMNELLVQPYIGSIADLREKTVIVDALNTAYALQLKKIFLMHGLKADRDYTVVPVGGTDKRFEAMLKNRDYAASMLFPPYSILAKREGLRSLGLAVDLLGPYQGTGAFVLRKCAEGHVDTVVRYIQAYVESLRWGLDETNGKDAVDLLASQMELPLDIAKKSYERLTDPATGLTPDARFDMDGFKNVLALRAEIEGQWDGKLPAPEKYCDLRYYQHALETLM
jgi:ABC-type nitrate/sulfonate/bicarbonate transport system substrate-binding protein